MMPIPPNLKSMTEIQLLKFIKTSKDKIEIEIAKSELLLRFWNK
jgi:hypothetical protein